MFQHKIMNKTLVNITIFLSLFTSVFLTGCSDGEFGSLKKVTRSSSSSASTSLFYADVAAGGVSSSSQGGYTCALLKTGIVKCWGFGEGGNLGNGTSGAGYRSTEPVSVSGISNASQIAAGKYHACAVLKSGRIKCWGLGSSGQMGNGEASVTVSTPVEVKDIKTAKHVSLGANHTCALLKSGSVKCWGQGRNGELGNGKDSTTESNTSYIERSPVSVTDIRDAIQVSVGSEHSCALLSSGYVKCWGSGTFGELGSGSRDSRATPVSVYNITDAIQISAGDIHTCAVLSTGQVTCWGYGRNGELGNSETSTQATPVMVTGITEARQVSSGSSYSCAVLSTATIQCWGDGEAGTLGNGGIAKQSSPTDVVDITNAALVSAGSTHTCAITDAPAIKCWGQGDHGELGNGQTADKMVPVEVEGLQDSSQEQSSTTL